MDFIMKVDYWIYKVLSKIGRNHQILVKYYRKKGVQIGSKCLICSNVLTREPFLVSIGNHTTISTNVTLLTHDYSSHLVIKGSSSLFGRITIGDNCFIGANSIIMYGVTLGNNVIVGSGSVVTKSFMQENIIIAGNPARVIGTWDEYRDRYSELAAPARSRISYDELYHELKLGKYLVKK